ncbi:DUF3263 domain-containing protein (plasmid) [Rhodococcus sp. USK10]|uniref:DUF3263 domain-containing protein n=1 Tax=Rhodococcus sp. USK10 TaxID=2789739 RepID=UPI001C5FB9A2|nr:DUF3263 domain-containing protein [Rhodococcus sp. USK10]QYB00259.1 DUF3263 domain-containing protein [Rhodococcus sp. USK10]
MSSKNLRRSHAASVAPSNNDTLPSLAEPRPSPAHGYARTIASSNDRHRHNAASAHRPATDVLNFAMKWRHWGGGYDEDIFVNFGLSPHQYFWRLRQLLSTPAAEHLSSDEIAQLREVCANRMRRQIRQSHP